MHKPHRMIMTGLAAAVLTLTACGSPQSTPTGQTQAPTETPSSSPAPATSATVPPVSTSPEQPPELRDAQSSRCAPTQLNGTIQPGDAAAGSRYAKLVVTNTGAAACTLYGYGGMQLVDAAGKPLPTTVTRTLDPKPALVRVNPGETAAKNLRWGVVPTGDEPVEGPCQPAASGATVIPPDDTQPLSVQFEFGSVCRKGTIDGSAYYK